MAEALALADEVGFERLTLSLLARRFGVAVPSLYKHVEGLPALRREVSLRAMAALGEALARALDGAPEREGLRALGRAFRAFALAHPGWYAATVRAPSAGDAAWSAASETVLRTVLGVLGTYRLSGDEAIDAARAVRAALHGFVSLETAGGFGLPRDVERSFERLLDLLDAALRGAGRRSAAVTPR